MTPRYFASEDQRITLFLKVCGGGGVVCFFVKKRALLFSALTVIFHDLSCQKSLGSTEDTSAKGQGTMTSNSLCHPHVRHFACGDRQPVARRVHKVQRAGVIKEVLVGLRLLVDLVESAHRSHIY
jgi:hypothetical protein